MVINQSLTHDHWFHYNLYVSYQETVNQSKSENTDETLVYPFTVWIISINKLCPEECKADDGIDVDYDQEKDGNPQQRLPYK